MRSALIVIDVQHDFCPGGALAVPGGRQVVPVCNRLMEGVDHVVLTQDWHPPGHSSFASSHAGRAAFSTLEFSYGPQVLWPDHCVQGTLGAQLLTGLEDRKARAIVRKGQDPLVDSYSAFFDNDHRSATGLGGLLKELGVEQVVLGGLALDYCVKYTALDARKLGFEVTVVADAVRGLGGSEEIDTVWTELSLAGVRIASADQWMAPGA